MISSVSRPERDRNSEKTLPPGPSDNASFDSRSRLARESRRDFTLWLKTADLERRPAQRQATRKRMTGTFAPRRSAASCSSATPLYYTLFCNFTELDLGRDKRQIRLPELFSNSRRASRNPQRKSASRLVDKSLINREGIDCQLCFSVLGQTLYEKSLQRKIGVGTLVNSQQRRALAIPVINRG